MPRIVSAAILACVVGGCASTPVAPPTPAILIADTIAPVGLSGKVAAPDPWHHPGTPLRVAPPPTPPEPGTAETRIENANAAARIEPSRPDYDRAAQIYVFEPHALYQVYAAPGRVTDIALQPGETLSPQGAIAAGDTARWIIGESLSGSGETARIHVLVKPIRPDLSTNLVIHTDRRTYLIELQARPDVYMASIAWRYPQDEELAVQRARTQDLQRRREPSVDATALNFNYRIEGDTVPWRPLHVFDDGRRVFIAFRSGLDQTTLPPLLVGGGGVDAALVNYRVEAGRMVVDRLFDRAELRLVEGRRDRVVRILRGRARP